MTAIELLTRPASNDGAARPRRPPGPRPGGYRAGFWLAASSS